MGPRNAQHPAAAPGTARPRLPGQPRTLRRLTAQLRRDTATPRPPPAPAAKKVATWDPHPPGKLTDADRAAHSPRSPTGAPNSPPPVPWSATSPTCFATATASTSKPGLPKPKTAPSASYAASPKDSKDWAAVTAGLTLPYSSGAVEGHVNRIKMIKRCASEFLESPESPGRFTEPFSHGPRALGYRLPGGGMTRGCADSPHAAVINSR